MCTVAQQKLPPAPGRPWSLPPAVRVLLVLTHLRTNLTTRALAALFHTSQSTVDRTIHHLVPVLANALRPAPNTSTHPRIIDGTLIPVHDQSITAISKNYRRSVNTQIIICAHRRSVVAVGRCWPGNRNDVIVARATRRTSARQPRDPRRRQMPRHHHDQQPSTRQHRTHHPRRHLPSAPQNQSPRRTCHRQTQRLADPSTVPPPRQRHQPEPPDHHWTLEPQNPQAITGQLLGALPPGRPPDRLTPPRGRHDHLTH